MRVVILGMGAMGRRHAAAVAAVPGLELTGVCDLRREALDASGLPTTVARSTDSAALLQALRPELVVISTTAPSHGSLVDMALASGARAILCEKPLAGSLVEGRRILDACRNAGVAVAVNHCRRHVAAYAWLARMVASGEWGQLRAIRTSCPGIGLGCLGTHFLDLMRFISGEEYVAITGWVDRELGPNPRGLEFHDPGGLVVAESASGARFVHQQIEDGGGPQSIVMDLTQARVVVEEAERRVQVIWRDPGVKPGPGRPPRFETLSPPSDAPLDLDIVGMISGVLRELAIGSPLACDGEHGYRSLEAVVAAYVSSNAGHARQPLPLSRPDHLRMELPIT